MKSAAGPSLRKQSLQTENLFAFLQIFCSRPEMNDTASAEAKEAGGGYASTRLEQAAICEFMCFLPRGKTMHRAQLFNNCRI